MSLHQDHNEPFRIFSTPDAAKKKTAIALQSARKVDCWKSNVTNYTEEAVKGVMIASWWTVL